MIDAHTRSVHVGRFQSDFTPLADGNLSGVAAKAARSTTTIHNLKGCHIMKRIPAPPTHRTVPVLSARQSFKLDRTGTTGEVDPWAFPTDVGIMRPNYGAHGGLKTAGKHDAAKKRRLFAHAEAEGRLVRR